jgi:hypothetical protein
LPDIDIYDYSHHTQNNCVDSDICCSEKVYKIEGVGAAQHIGVTPAKWLVDDFDGSEKHLEVCSNLHH